MLFKQLFENESCTYTYLISCPDKKEAVLIDPVIETIERVCTDFMDWFGYQLDLTTPGSSPLWARSLSWLRQSPKSL